MTAPMKPFVVEYTVRAVIVAEDEVHAHQVAASEFREVCRDERPLIHVEGEVLGKTSLPDGWDLQCLPYGGDGKTRLNELIPDPQEASAVKD